ncbi:MAG: hypothetical protein WAM22_02190, partial [Nitrososphaeraceae archaeon]
MEVPDTPNDTKEDGQDTIRNLLSKLHEHYLRDNMYDEGDLLFYRINYRLMDTLRISKAAAEEFHKIYHTAIPRRVSGGYCKKCEKIITIIPIIYGA